MKQYQPNILLNTSDPTNTLDPDNIRIDVHVLTTPTLVNLSAAPAQLSQINLTPIRLAAINQNPKCSNHNEHIPDSNIKLPSLGNESTSIRITVPGHYYFYGNRQHNEALFQPCDPVVIEAIPLCSDQ